MKKPSVTTIANIIVIFAIFALTIMPLVAGAQQQGFDRDLLGNEASRLGVAEDATVGQIVIRVIEFLLAVVGLIAVVFLIVGGFRYITAGGNDEASESGKKTITNAIIGIAIVILAFVIVRVVANALIDSNVAP